MYMKVKMNTDLAGELACAGGACEHNLNKIKVITYRSHLFSFLNSV